MIRVNLFEHVLDTVHTTFVLCDPHEDATP